MKRAMAILSVVAFTAIAAGAAEPIPRGLVEAILPNSSVRETTDGLLVTAPRGQIWRVGRYSRQVIFRNSDGHTVIRAQPVGSPETWKVEYSDGRTATVTVDDRTARYRTGNASKDRTSRRSQDGWSTFPPP